jgi:hypothetical protein
MTVNRGRMKVWREVTSLDLDYENITSAIATLERYRADYGDACHIQKVEYAYEDGFYYSIMCERDETDAEMNKRIAQEEKWEAILLQNEREEFERLKVKFGG